MEQEILNLLDKKNRFLCLMIDLCQKEEDWLSIYKLNLELNRNQRSIQRYIHCLEEKVAEYNSESKANIEMTYDKYKGIKITYGQSAAFKLKNFIISNDDTIKLLNELIFFKVSSIEMYSRNHFTSEYSLKNSLKKINELLQSFQLKLSKHQPNFEGPERNIRIFIYIYLWTIHKDDDWPFDYISENKIYTSVDNFSKNIELNFTNIHRKQMAYLLSVNLLRNKRKFYIKKDADWDKYVDLEIIKQSPIVIQGMENYHYYIENDIYFLLLLIQMKYRIFKSKLLREKIFSYHKKRDSDVYILTNKMMLLFQKKFFVIPPDMKDVFFTYCFCAHLFCKVFRGVRFDIDGYDVLIENDNAPELLNKLHDFFKELRNDFDSPIFLEESFLIRKYFLLFSYLKNPTIYEPKIAIGIDSDLPFFIRESIKKDIKKRFENRYNLEVIESNELEMDIILTNMPSLHDNEKYICVISYPLQNKEYQMIEHNLAKVLTEKR